MEKKEYTLALLVTNKPDVLARVAGVLGGRGYNIETLCVDATLDPRYSKIVLTTVQDKGTIGKIEKQLIKLIDVLKVTDITETEAVSREMILVRMRLTDKNKVDLALILNAYNARVVTMNGDHCVIEVTGEKAFIERAIESLKPLGIDDSARTGIVALERQ
jgi:acetolactate synthase I/III small subunit